MEKSASGSGNPIVSEEREVPFTLADFNQVRKELYDHAGITLADHKKDMAYNRLVRRLRQLDIASFKQYFQLLKKSPDEFAQFINAMTTNLTSFFREKHHFDYLAEVLLPDCMVKQQRTLKGWSAGCSIGEETYSIAIALLDEAERLGGEWRFDIFATDIDSKVLATAKSGVYPLERVQMLSEGMRRRWFLKGVGDNTGRAVVKDELKKTIQFSELNLMGSWAIDQQLDFIFCRNVMIYFDTATQTRLLEQMADQVKPGGLLFVGHSESPYRLTDRFELIGKTIYRRVC